MVCLVGLIEFGVVYCCLVGGLLSLLWISLCLFVWVSGWCFGFLWFVGWFGA